MSLIDFPGKIAAVAFTQGCNFRCQFCHNESLVIPEKFQSPMDEEEFFNFLVSRRGKLDAVVVSGGEPTLHVDIVEFFEKIKNLGFLTKLDTNGTRPDVLKNLCEKNLLDYVAMDVKHRFDKYDDISGVAVDISAIAASIDLIKNSGVDYEFRTTVVPHFHRADDIEAIASQLSGAKRFVIQEFVPDHAINGNLSGENSLFSPQNRETMDALAAFCKSHVEEFSMRSAS